MTAGRRYQILCISMYEDDLGRMDETVRTLKRRGVTRANRSALIRAAVSELSLDKAERLIKAEKKG